MGMSEHKQANEIAPAKGRARAVDLNGSTVDEYDMNDLFPDIWNNGEMYSFSCAVAYFVITSTTSGDTYTFTEKIGDDSDVGETADQHMHWVPAGASKRWFLDKNHRYLYVKGASAGTLFIAQSSSKDR